MKTLLVVVVLLLAGIAGLGFYRGWFHFSTTDGTDRKPSATITVDKDNRLSEDLVCIFSKFLPGRKSAAVFGGRDAK